ncbi:hypothetical protein SEVIR_6G008750v4 [Setaria viridis]|uniref:Uncharacterized protein n=1 Tax=Setaria viridis TaxID=4556 RepID=A0A4U6TYN6_SETVI|nr:hypothetical protein SEVIR_6G008750v2 [Setaria viridis]
MAKPLVVHTAIGPPSGLPCLRVFVSFDFVYGSATPSAHQPRRPLLPAPPHRRLERECAAAEDARGDARLPCHWAVGPLHRRSPSPSGHLLEAVVCRGRSCSLCSAGVSMVPVDDGTFLPPEIIFLQQISRRLRASNLCSSIYLCICIYAVSPPLCSWQVLNSVWIGVGIGEDAKEIAPAAAPPAYGSERLGGEEEKESEYSFRWNSSAVKDSTSRAHRRCHPARAQSVVGPCGPILKKLCGAQRPVTGPTRYGHFADDDSVQTVCS